MNTSTTRPLDGRVTIVTGASRGIGAATARALHRAGSAVVLAARDADALNALAAEIADEGGRATAVPTDVTDAGAVDRLVRQTLDTYGRLDAACNNAAGGGHPPTPLADVAVEDFDSAFAVNLRGVFLAMRAEIPAMLESGGGAIVNMASTAGLQAVGGLAGYVSTKFGLVGLTQTAALDYAEAGVRVNALAPGPILTDQLERAGEQAQAAAAQAMPMRRIGSPDEVADAVVWLCSDAASFITGAVLPIDGGKLAGMAPFSRTRPAKTPVAG
ncbi:SDR family oxidoreductase [Actinomadura logoneensis]|uniref:SDR family oxidoreductase n=1 Tax=Actinomadura logoneensis TaxID=2293572 RepID=A0A372JKZ6_9ACTN|nr:glucose 1-dehydrogenase [Actinomadura logoneensis]RFU40687.1 SDR family oxidoreductase [Actinomadura logoneensis]